MKAEDLKMGMKVKIDFDRLDIEKEIDTKFLEGVGYIKETCTDTPLVCNTTDFKGSMYYFSVDQLTPIEEEAFLPLNPVPKLKFPQNKRELNKETSISHETIEQLAEDIREKACMGFSEGTSEEFKQMVLGLLNKEEVYE